MKCASVPPTPARSNGRRASFIRTSNATIPSACPRRGYDSHWANRAFFCSMPRAMDSPCRTRRTIPNLTYDLRQIAVFGEATYTLFDRLGVTAGLRWYDWEEDKTFKSGGALLKWSTAQSQNVTVSSNGLTPRFMVRLRRDGPRSRERAGVTGISSGRRERSVERNRCVGMPMIPTGGSSGSRTKRCGTTKSASNPRTRR